MMNSISDNIWYDNQEDQLINALDSCSMVSITDVKGNIIYANEKFCTVSGYRQDELLGRNHRMLKSGIQPDAIFDELWQTISSGRTWKGIVCNKNKKGKFHWFKVTIVPFRDSSGEIEKFVAIRFGITKLIEKEAELTEARSTLQDIFNYAPNAFFIIDRDGNIIDCNIASEHLTGYGKKELQHHNIIDLKLLSDFDRKRFLKSMNNPNCDISQHSFSIHTKLGVAKEVDVVSHEIKIDNRDVILSIASDVTERKKLLKELKQKNIDLETFLYRASHDMKSPLTTMEGLIHLCKKEEELSRLKEMLDMIETTLKNGKLMNDNLNSARAILKGDIGFERINLRELVSNVVQNLNYMENFHDILIHISIPTETQIISNAYLMHSIMTNLVQNAIKYSRPKTSTHSPAIYISSNETKDTLVINIIDNGMGIQPEDQDKIFDMYFRSNSVKEGSGLGLYITKNAVEKLGGTIDFSCYKNEMTKFEVELPYKLAE